MYRVLSNYLSAGSKCKEEMKRVAARHRNVPEPLYGLRKEKLANRYFLLQKSHLKGV